MLRGLYAITPDTWADSSLLDRIAMAVAGGAALVQYRDKRADHRRRAARARALLAVCRHYGVRLLINDDLPLALAIGADGVHLGADDGDLRAARQALPPGALLGASCYADFARAQAAAAAGADYLAFGAANVAHAQFVFNRNTGALYWDSDGTGSAAPILVATLVGVSSITAADIRII